MRFARIRSRATGWITRSVAMAMVAVLTVTAAGSAASGQSSKVVDVFVLSGQSNAVGISAAVFESELEGVLGADSDTHVTALFKQAYSGTSIEVDWKPDGTAGNDGEGTIYLEFQAGYAAFMDDLAAAHPDAEIRMSGLFWNQGERDARLGHGDVYEDNLNLMIQDFRVTMGAPQMPVFVSRIKGINNYVDNDQVRAAQQAVGETDPFVYTIDVDDIGPFDGLHWTNGGHDKLAERYADVYGQLLVPGWGECGTGLVTVAECVRVAEAVLTCVNQDGDLRVVLGAAYAGDLQAGVGFGPGEASTATVNATTSAEFTLEAVSDGTVSVSVFGDSFEVDRRTVEVACNRYIKGDANCDASVTAADVDSVLRFLVDGAADEAGCSEEPHRLSNCDLDPDEACRLADARAIAVCLSQSLDVDPIACD